MNEDIKTTSKVIYHAPEKSVHSLRSDLNLRGKVLEVMKMLPWASKRHIQLWIRGIAPNRDSGIEGVLKQLIDWKKLKSTTIGNGPQLVYTCRRRTNEEAVAHLLGNTECLVRIKVASPDALPISEKEFRGFGAVPEGGFLYPNGTLLLLEYSTANDWKKTRRLTRKIIVYRKHLEKIGEAFGGNAAVLFIADVNRELIARMVTEFSSQATEGDQFYFTDYETFKNVEMGQARNAEIYYFVDGKVYNLK